jgi:GTP cyclohydrolase II
MQKEPTEMHVPKRIRPQVPSNTALRAVPAPQAGPENPTDEIVIDAVSPVPTEHGTFLMYVFRWVGDDEEHVAMVRGDVSGKHGVAVRVHSECLTSEVFHSLKCDCREQLHLALDEIAGREEGVLLYLRQEGRGIGLANKIKAYALQAHGADTVDANRMLGLPDDARRYDMAALMLRQLGVQSIKLMTNNPQKVEELRALGVVVDDRLPVLITPNRHSEGYLEAKRVRMRHQLPQLAQGRPSTNSLLPKTERTSLTGSDAE